MSRTQSDTQRVLRGEKTHREPFCYVRSGMSALAQRIAEEVDELAEGKDWQAQAQPTRRPAVPSQRIRAARLRTDALAAKLLGRSLN